MKKGLLVGLPLVFVAVMAAVWALGRADTPSPAEQAGPARPRTDDRLGACDAQAAPPRLPQSLSPSTPDLPGVIRALDTALTDEHRAWIRCFTLDDELLARTHLGFGRWLRTTLRLWRPSSPIVASLQAKSPDDASAIIIIAYAHHLRGEELTPAAASVRLQEALAAAGVVR